MPELGPYLVLVLLATGLVEVAWREARRDRVEGAHSVALLPLLGTIGSVGGLGALVWVAFKVGALSYSGGFVIVPLMQPTLSTPITG